MRRWVSRRRAVTEAASGWVMEVGEAGGERARCLRDPSRSGPRINTAEGDALQDEVLESLPATESLSGCRSAVAARARSARPAPPHCAPTDDGHVLLVPVDVSTRRLSDRARERAAVEQVELAPPIEEIERTVGRD